MADTIAAANKALQTLAAQIRDRTVANKQLAVKLEGEVLRNFASEGAEFGLPWAPLKPATILARLNKGKQTARVKAAKGLINTGQSIKQARKALGGGIVQTLQDTSAMKQTFAGFSTEDEAGVGARSNTAHADLTLVHQYGSPTRNIPARPMLPPVELALGWAVQIYQRHVDNAREKANL